MSIWRVQLISGWCGGDLPSTITAGTLSHSWCERVCEAVHSGGATIGHRRRKWILAAKSIIPNLANRGPISNARTMNRHRRP